MPRVKTNEWPVSLCMSVCLGTVEDLKRLFLSILMIPSQQHGCYPEEDMQLLYRDWRKHRDDMSLTGMHRHSVANLSLSFESPSATLTYL